MVYPFGGKISIGYHQCNLICNVQCPQYIVAGEEASGAGKRTSSVCVLFLAQFIPASLLGVSAVTEAEQSGGLIGNDWNSDGEHNR
jgi:hypothetical protein